MRSGSAPDTAPWIALAALGFAAAVLALIGLGDLPCQDFDEATVARVALELRHGLGEAPLLPTIWGQPYLNKAPGLHSLIALVISATTQHNQLPSEWTIRLAPALLSCLVVPLGLAAMDAATGRSLQRPRHQRESADAIASGPPRTSGHAGWCTANSHGCAVAGPA